MTDTILLTFPSKSSFRGVPSLVLGGVGSRLNLPFERMDDLQLAVLSMLDASSGDDASVEIGLGTTASRCLSARSAPRRRRTRA